MDDIQNIIDNRKKAYIQKLEKVQGMSNEEWLKYRNARWAEKRKIYSDPENVPKWYSRKKPEETRKRSWAANCKKYSSTEPAQWFMNDKAKYIAFLEKLIKEPVAALQKSTKARKEFIENIVQETK